MNLVVYELTSNSAPDYLRQKVLTDDRIIRLSAVRPHLLKFGVPSGSLYMQLQNSSGTTLADSEVIACSAISASDYFHGYLTFDLSYILEPSTQYYFQLKSLGGYAYADTAYIGWCNSFDDQKYPYSGITPLTDFDVPFGLELWEFKTVTKGTYP